MAGYVRQSSFVDGDTITAALFNDEYNQLVNAFHNATGHAHDGTTASGPVIGLIGDAGETSPNNKVLIDTTNNYIEFYVQVSSSPVQQLYIADGAIVPVTDNDIDLGTSSLEFKDLFLDGTAHIDTLDVDANAGIIGNATVGGTLGVTGNTTLTANLTVNGNTTLGNAASDTVTITADVASHVIPSADSTYTLGDGSNYWSHGYIDAITTTGNVAVGGNLTVTGTTTFNGGTITMGDSASDNVVFGADIDSHIIPDDDNTYDLGSSTQEWRNLYIDGTANIDSLVADTADINGGTIDAATIATSDITVGSGKTLDVSSGTLTLAANQISGDKVEGGTIAATTVTTLTSTTGNITNVNATTVDTTNIEVTNLKAKDGTAAGAIADSTGVVTLASSVLTTTDINGGTIDGTTVGANSASTGAFTSVTTTGNLSVGGNLDVTGTIDFSDSAITNVGSMQLDSIAGDADSNTSITFSGSDVITVAAGGDNQVTFTNGAIVPSTDNDIDLGTSSVEFKDAYFDGTVTTDALVADTADINGGTVDGATIGASSASTGAFTTLTTSGNATVGGNLTVTGTTTFNGGTITMGDAATDNVVFGADVDSNIIPDDDNTYDLGSSSQEWRNLYIDGTANIDSLVADTADINGGTVDGAVIGGSSAAAITGTAITGTSFVIGSANISEAELETIDGVTAGTVAASKAVVVDSNKDIGTFRNLTIDGVFTDGNYTFDTSGNVTGLGTIASGAITSSGVITGTGFTIGSAVINEAELETIDGITAGTVIASKAIITDANIDITGGRNITISGELDAATLDISGNADIDGTLEADAYTVNGTNLSEYIEDTVGAMLSSNTETGIAVTYQDGDSTIDFALDAAQTGITSLLATDIKIGEDDQTKIDFETADEIHFYAANAEQVYVADGIFGPQTDSDVDLGSTSVRWKDAYVDSITTTGNASVGGNLTLTGNLVVNGTTTTVNSTTVTIDDPIFTLGGDTAPGSDDNKDRGIEFRWHNGSAAKVGFFGYDDSAAAFTVVPDATNSSEVFSGTVGNAIFGNITGTLQTAAQANITSVGTLTALTGGTGDFNWDSNTLVVDSSANRVGIGNASPDVSLDIGSFTDAVHVPVGTTAQRPGSPAAGYFRYNSTTSKFEGYTDEWGSIGGGSGTNMDTNIFAGDGSDTTFTLSNAPDDEQNLMVFIDGVYQAHDSFSVSGTTLTFSTAPANGRVITVYHSTTTVGGSNNTINTMTGDNSDTTLTLSVAPVHENNVQVYFDGVYQSKSNYSISGTTLTFSTAPATGVLVEAITNTNTSSTTANLLLDADSDTKIQVEESSDEDKIRFDTGGTERMIIDSTGVGIGDTAPDNKLQISDSSVGTDATANDSNYIKLTNKDAGTVNELWGLGFSTESSGTDYLGAYVHALGNYASNFNTSLVFGTRPTSSGAPAERMRIDSSGKVGIKQTTPVNLLHVGGADGESYVKFTSDATGHTASDGARIGLNSDDLRIVNAEGSGHMMFETANTERMRIHASGGVSVGSTTDPGDGVLAADNFTLNGGGGVKGVGAIDISTTATAITAANDFGSLVIVAGNSGGNMFSDLVFYATTVGATVVAGGSVSGSPQARTYSVASSILKLAMASGTYSVSATTLQGTL